MVFFTLSYYSWAEKKPWKWGWESPLSIVWISGTINMLLFFQFKLKMAIHTAHTKKKLCEVNNFWYFLNSYFIFSRRVSFPFKCSKAIFWRSRKQNVKVSPLTWTIVMPHGNNEFSKLLNLFPVKIFSLILTPGSAHVSVKTKSQVGSIWVKDTKK